MHTVTFGIGNSLDDFMARPEHTVGWHTWSDEVSRLTAAYWNTVALCRGILSLRGVRRSATH